MVNTARRDDRLWPVLGVDPGGRSTGIVAREGQDVLGHTVVTRGPTETWRTYTVRVMNAIQGLLVANPDLWLAVEGLVRPTGQMGMMDPATLYRTARILGAIEWQWPEVVVVRPGGHGAAPLQAYPPELVGPREKKGGGVLRHARSAYDIAWLARNAPLWVEDDGVL
jgi:hypothetical protein